MKTILIALMGVLIISCNSNTKNNQPDNVEKEVTESLDWLIGNWKRSNEEAGKETFENWSKISAGNYSGIGFTLQKGDTISQEKMDIVEANGKWTLLVKLPKEKEPTLFAITELKNRSFICVNDSNDFPKKIHYWSEGEKIKATISNTEMEIPFEFEKIK